MGIFDKVKELKEGLMTEYDKFANKKLMEGTMAAIAFTANANGKVKDDEMQMMVGLIGRDEDLKVYDLTEMTGAFNKRMEGFALSPIVGKSECISVIQKVTDPEQAKMLVVKCCAIAAADGEFDKMEKDVVREICKAVKLNPRDFDL